MFAALFDCARETPVLKPSLRDGLRLIVISPALGSSPAPASMMPMPPQPNGIPQCGQQWTSSLIRIRRALKFPVPHDQRLFPHAGHCTEWRQTLTVQIQHTSPGTPKTPTNPAAVRAPSVLISIAPMIIEISKSARTSEPSVISARSCAARLNCLSSCNLRIVFWDGPSTASSHKGETAGTMGHFGVTSRVCSLQLVNRTIVYDSTKDLVALAGRTVRIEHVFSLPRRNRRSLRYDVPDPA